MTYRSVLACLCFAMLSQLSSGCWCYRPILGRFSCANQHFPLNSSGPAPSPILAGQAPSPIFNHSPILGGCPILGGDIGHGSAGCANCGSALIFTGASAMPVSNGPMLQNGINPGLQHGSGFGGLPPGKPGMMSGPYVPPGGYPQPTVGSPPNFTNYPVFNTPPAPLGSPTLGPPTVSKELPLPTAMPSRQ